MQPNSGCIKMVTVGKKNRKSKVLTQKPQTIYFIQHQIKLKGNIRAKTHKVNSAMQYTVF